MINSQELYEIIDNYLNDNMSERERIDFEEKITHDETLATRVNEARATNEAIYFASLAELKNTIGQEIKNIKYEPPFNWRNATYISIASLVILSGITTYILTKDSNSESGKTELKSIIIDSTKISVPGNINSNSIISQRNSPKNSPISILNKKESLLADSLITDSKSKNESIPTNVFIQKNVNETPNIVSANKMFPATVETHSQKKETELRKEPSIICDKSFKINTTLSCKYAETGSIEIISDGTKEYTFQVDYRTSSGSTGMFQDLPSGDYEVLVTYSKQCSYTKKVTIGEQWCPMNNAYSFNPNHNEKWVMKYEPGTSGTFTIFDRSGKEIYKSSFGSGDGEWNGLDTHGMQVPIDVYIAFINYSDGRLEKVELTIVR